VSELIESGADSRKDVLKHLILQLHAGVTAPAVQRQLVRLLGQVPYGLVVEVEQELIEDGMPPEEVTRLCHLHSAALEGAIDLSGARFAPPGHPVHTFRLENEALGETLAKLDHAAAALAAAPDAPDPGDLLSARVRLNELADVEKHYLRKEHLLFPYLEKHGITGPPKVMWGKHDETRALLRAALEALADARAPAPALRAASEAVRGMIDKEENILLPMALDTLDELEWWEIARQSAEIGFCLVEPAGEWRPEGLPAGADAPPADGKLRLPTGTLTATQIEAILNALPLDATFVDAEDRVRYFTHGKERVFARSRAVIGRKVQFCHPPSSVDTVDRILSAFRAGERDEAAFWIELRGRFLHIAYHALRGPAGEYLGCLEVTQDLTAKRALTGERRLLAWDAPAEAAPAEAAPAEAAPTAACPAHVGGEADAAERRVAAPAWATGAAASRRLDARPLLARGAHPVERVLSDLGALAAEEVYELTTPFVPAPLIERAAAAGYAAHPVADEAGTVRTYFRRGAGA
jgi:DUF438 domain-containing protein